LHKLLHQVLSSAPAVAVTSTAMRSASIGEKRTLE